MGKDYICDLTPIFGSENKKKGPIYFVYIMFNFKRLEHETLAGASITNDITGLRDHHDRRYHYDLVFIDYDSL